MSNWRPVADDDHIIRITKAGEDDRFPPTATLEEILLRHLVDDLPGNTVSIGHSDGQWHISQHYTGLEESVPLDVVGVGSSIREAVENAIKDKTA